MLLLLYTNWRSLGRIWCLLSHYRICGICAPWVFVLMLKIGVCSICAHKKIMQNKFLFQYTHMCSTKIRMKYWSLCLRTTFTLCWFTQKTRAGEVGDCFLLPLFLSWFGVCTAGVFLFLDQLLNDRIVYRTVHVLLLWRFRNKNSKKYWQHSYCIFKESGFAPASSRLLRSAKASR